MHSVQHLSWPLLRIPPVFIILAHVFIILTRVQGMSRAVLKEPNFLSNDRPQGPPTANHHQLPTANCHQPPTANRESPPAANRQPWLNT